MNMAKFPTYEQMAKDVAEKALDEYVHNGKTLREWIKIIAEQEPKIDVLEQIRADIIKYESDCRLSTDESPTCKECNDNVFKTIYEILDKYKAESERSDDEERSS